MVMGDKGGGASFVGLLGLESILEAVLVLVFTSHLKKTPQTLKPLASTPTTHPGFHLALAVAFEANRGSDALSLLCFGLRLHSCPPVKRTPSLCACFILPVQVCLKAFVCGEDGRRDVTSPPPPPPETYKHARARTAPRTGSEGDRYSDKHPRTWGYSSILQLRSHG